MGQGFAPTHHWGLLGRRKALTHLTKPSSRQISHYAFGMGQSPSHASSPRQRVLFAIFLLALFPAGNALQPKLDEDTWWHLAVGRYVVENRAVPTTDPFSRIGQDEQIPWVAYSWLHEVALYEAYELGGLSGVLAFRHLLDSLTFLTIAWFV